MTVTMTTSGTDGESVIDRLAEQHDLSREEATAIVEEIQDGTDRPILCERCGAYHDEKGHRWVARYTMPDEQTVSLCHVCYAEIVTETTTLSPQEAQVLALRVAGASRSDIQTKLEIASSNLTTVLGRINDKRQTALDDLERAHNTLAVTDVEEV